MNPLIFKGPPFSEGIMPAVFYFALSAEESLSLDPYNQPVKMLEEKRVRIFSATLPFHGPEWDNKEAMKHWAENPNSLIPFINETHKEILELIIKGVIDPGRMAAMGLSRGAFAAAHLAAKEPRIDTLLGFAPLISLDKEHALSLENIAATLIGKNVRFYIGNRDQRVGTDQCFSFIHHLADLSYHAGYRSPPVELIISPSIGHKGHGTAPQIFQDGINWLTNKLNI